MNTIKEPRCGYGGCNAQCAIVSIDGERVRVSHCEKHYLIRVEAEELTI